MEFSDDDQNGLDGSDVVYEKANLGKAKRSFKKGSRWYSVINVEPRGVTVFFRQMAAMIGAGMPLLKALRTISKNDERGISQVINIVANDVERGESLSTALGNFPNIFSNVYINLLVVAEQGGSLEETLRGLANLTESEDMTKNQIKRALLYPSITLFIALGVFVFVVSYVIPTFISNVLGTSENLGAITSALFNVAWFFNNFWWALLIGAVAAGFGIYYSGQNPEGKRFWDRFKLRVPVLGVILKKIAIMNFARSFGMLMQSGMPVIKSVKLLEQNTDNMVYSDILGKTHDAVEKGSKIYEPISESKMFPPFVVDLITVGESTGQLDTMLIKIADAYQDEVEQVTKNLGTLIEPVLLLVIGVFTSLIVFSVFSTYIRTLSMLS